MQGASAPAGGLGVAMAASEVLLAVCVFSSGDTKAFLSVFSSDTKAFSSVFERDAGRGFSAEVTRKLSRQYYWKRFRATTTEIA